MALDVQPALFVSHGSPLLALDTGAYAAALRRFSGSVRPSAIAVISAHWLSREGLFVTSSGRPETLYDFGGFPRALYELSYPARGARELARRIVDKLSAMGLSAVPKRRAGSITARGFRFAWAGPRRTCRCCSSRCRGSSDRSGSCRSDARFDPCARRACCSWEAAASSTTCARCSPMTRPSIPAPRPSTTGSRRSSTSSTSNRSRSGRARPRPTSRCPRRSTWRRCSWCSARDVRTIESRPCSRAFSTARSRFARSRCARRRRLRPWPIRGSRGGC
ncbi:MAG: dioxygenase [Deltaproteobacteria bacterium]|nr:dioxygenase [Deltaproteobacteria bacterium]